MKSKSDQTRQKILSAALYEFSMHGLAGARVDEIAKAARVNKAMIYYHFDSKEALFNELFQTEMELLKQETAAVLQPRDPDSAADMTLAVKELLKYVTSKKELLKVLISESTRQDAHLPHLFQLLDVTTAIGLEAAQKSDRTLPDEEEPVFHEFFSGLLPLIYYVLLRDSLKKYYGWKEKTMDDRFIAYWLRHHAGYYGPGGSHE
jgi:AcrR family transcriptional regulator